MKKQADITYNSYLQLDRLLATQKPVSKAHDETMFIIVHQAYELWFNLILFELDRVQDIFDAKKIRDHDLRMVSASLNRIVTILRHIIGQMDIMETMTPLDFLDFRHVFRSASGFQSLQFRALEIRLGLRLSDRVGYDGKSFEAFLSKEDRASLQKLTKKLSLLDQVDQWLARTPFVSIGGYSFWNSYRNAVKSMIDGDRQIVNKSKKMTPAAKAAEARKLAAMQQQFDALFGKQEGLNWRFSMDALQAALFINLYRDEPVLQIPHKILSDLMDIDELLALWRHRHALMAQRMLGTKMGSGGSSGHDYLAATATRHRIFGDLFSLSTFLIPRSRLPKLPKTVTDKMGFRYWDKNAA